MNMRPCNLLAVGMLTIGWSAWGAATVAPQCDRIESEEILKIAPAELRARGLDLVAADVKTASAAFDVVNEYLDCLKRAATNKADAKIRELTGPQLVHAPELQGPPKDVCLQSAVKALLRILRDDTTAVYIDVMHPLDLLVARLESDGVYTCWQASASGDSCGDAVTPPHAWYSSCLEEETDLVIDRSVGGIAVRVSVGRGDLDVLSPLSEGTWDCPDAGVEIYIGPLPESEWPPRRR